MKKTIRITLVLILLLILTFNVLAIFNIPFLGYRMYTVKTGSMEPTIKTGDYIIIKSSKKYKVGDIITYKNDNNELITHRIIEINNKNIITKGDANNVEDEPIKKKQIVGKLKYKFKYIKNTKTIFTSPIFWILVFILGTLVTLVIPNKDKI